jgi:uncharacterized repeat protein (TIGR01451 family)
MYRGSIYNLLGVLIALSLASVALPQGTSKSLGVKAVAEIEIRGNEGRDAPKLVPADKVVPGDRIIYTLEVRNIGKVPVRSPTVIYAIPAHMWYLADSAVGPAAEVSYSIDGGQSFDAPDTLRVQGSDGQWRTAAAADYTHIRWQLKNNLKANSTAFVRFRTVVRQ